MTNKHNKENIAKGLSFLLIAIAILILSFKPIGFLADHSVMELILSGIFIYWIIKNIISKNFISTIWPISFLILIYDAQLGLENLTPWPILLIALFSTIGLSLIFKKGSIVVNRRSDNFFDDDDFDDFDEFDDDDCDKEGKFDYHFTSSNKKYDPDFDDEFFTERKKENKYNEDKYIYHAKEGKKEKFYEHVEDGHYTADMLFGKKIIYANPETFKTAEISANFGELIVYFDNAENLSKKIDIKTDCNFGSLKLYFPSNWKIKSKSGSTLGYTENKTLYDDDQDGPIVYVSSSTNFGHTKLENV